MVLLKKICSKGHAAVSFCNSGFVADFFVAGFVAINNSSSAFCNIADVMGETSATLVMLYKLPKKNIRSLGVCHVGHVFCERGGEREPQNQPVEGNHFPIKIQNKYDDSGNLYTIIRALHVHAY